MVHCPLIALISKSFCKISFDARIFKISFLLFGIMVVTNAGAVPISDIDIGDTYYINNLFTENDLVVVKRIDTERGLIKVQYISGGIDWLHPSKLFTKTVAKNADTDEAIIGTTMIAGTLWAIFDPEGFKKEMSNQKSSSSSSTLIQPDKSAVIDQSSKSSGSNYDRPVAISALPFAPIVEGTWIDKGKEWRDWSMTVLLNQLGKSVAIESVRIKNIPFYSTADREVALVEAVQTGRSGAYYIIAVVGKYTNVVLDGKGPSIHKMNEMLGIYIDSPEKAMSYLKFFTSAISADDGIFVILDSSADYLDQETLNQIGVKPIQIYGGKTGGWKIFASIIYGNNAFDAEFLVHQDGVVEMVNDSPKQKLSFKYRVVIAEGRRFYVGQ